MNFYSRMVTRMYDGIRSGAPYACAVIRYESRNERIFRRATKVMYWIAPVAILVAVVA